MPSIPASSSDFSGDLSRAEFRAALKRVADMIADYAESVERYPVMPPIAPGDVRRRLPGAPPTSPEPIDRILDDYQRLIEPNITHWNHPGFMAYFAITGSAPGVLGEALAAGLNTNAMLWRTGPAPTELEEVTCDWLRQMVRLPAEFKGHINDTASMSTLLALACARQAAPGLEVRRRGLAGRPEVGPLTVYASEQAHSSVDKAVIALGLGLDNLRRIEVDDAFRLRPEALEAAIARDRVAGMRPVAIVATAGTTATTSVDPLRPIAEIARREGLWLHIDAAYAGSAAICPEFRELMDGLELGDSIVMNPHKWLFVPVDCSLLYLRDVNVLKEAFSVVPEYLRTSESGVTNLMDLGVQLGRRFRSLKLWFVLRAFGVQGLQERIRYHCRLASELAGWVDAAEEFERCAPTPFSTVCFRATPAVPPERQDAMNERILARVNAEGEVFLSHAKLRGRTVLRLAIGNLGTERRHVTLAWDRILAAHDALAPEF